MCRHHRRDHLPDGQCFASAAPRITRAEPVEAEVGVIAASLLRVEQSEPLLVGELGPPGAAIVAGGILSASVKHNHQGGGSIQGSGHIKAASKRTWIGAKCRHVREAIPTRSAWGAAEGIVPESRKAAEGIVQASHGCSQVKNSDAQSDRRSMLQCTMSGRTVLRARALGYRVLPRLSVCSPRAAPAFQAAHPDLWRALRLTSICALNRELMPRCVGRMPWQQRVHPGRRCVPPLWTRGIRPGRQPRSAPSMPGPWS